MVFLFNRGQTNICANLLRRDDRNHRTKTFRFGSFYSAYTLPTLPLTKMADDKIDTSLHT